MMTLQYKLISLGIALGLSGATATELRFESHGVIHSDRQFYTGHFDPITFTTTYENIDTSGLSFNVNVSCIVVKDFYESASTARGAGESGTFVRTVTDSNSGVVSAGETAHSQNSGATETALGSVETDDLIFNLEDDTYVSDGMSFTISGADLLFSIPTALDLPDYGVYEVYLTNDVGEQLSDVQLVTFGTPEREVEYLAGYDFDNGEGVPSAAVTYTQQNIIASDYTVGAGLNQVITNGGNGLSARLDADGNRFGTANPISFGGSRADFGFADQDNADNLTKAITDQDYMTFTIEPSGIYAINLSSLTFRSRVNHVGNAAERWALFSSVNGFAEESVIATGSTTQTGTYVGHEVDLSNTEYQGLEEAITFRLYIYGGNNTSSSATLFDKVMVKGATSARNILAGYDFDLGDGTPTTEATFVDGRIIASEYGVGAGLNAIVDSSGNSLTNNLDASGDVFGTATARSFGGARSTFGFADMNNNANLTSAIVNEDYMTFTLTPRTVYALDLTELSFRCKTNHLGNGAEHWAVFSSIGGFTEDAVITSGSISQTGAYENFIIDLTGSGFQRITEPVTFRIYIYGGNSTSSSATLYDKILLKGAASAMPAAGYRAWLVSNEMSFDSSDPEQSDHDTDGVENVVEYVFGGNPRRSDRPTHRLRLERVGRTLNFRRNSRSAHDTKQVVEYSADLQTWHELAEVDAPIPDGMVTVESESTDTDLVTVDLSSIPEDRCLFVRLAVTYEE